MSRRSKSFPLLVGMAALFVVVVTGGILAVRHFAVDTNDTTPTSLPDVTLPPKGSSQRFFGPKAPWNTPVADLGRSDRYASYAQRWWSYAAREWWDKPADRGKVVTSFHDYSIPIYDAREATGRKRVITSRHGFPGTMPADSEVPWNDAWQPAKGNDQSMLIIDPDNGRDYELWLVQKTNFTDCLGVGWRPGDLCVGSADLIPQRDGQPADYRTYEGGFIARGMGLQKLALLTRADEVASGSIDHALGMIMFATMFGPQCTSAQLDSAAAGTTCGFYVNPATRLEWADGASQQCGQAMTSADRVKTVPEGMRFALDISDADIETWLDSRGYRGELRSTARVFAVALRDYGWIVADTSCSHAGIETEGFQNPVAHAKWRKLGIPEDASAETLLDGLITRDRVYTVTPPANPTPVSTKLDPSVK